MCKCTRMSPYASVWPELCIYIVTTVSLVGILSDVKAHTARIYTVLANSIKIECHYNILGRDSIKYTITCGA